MSFEVKKTGHSGAKHDKGFWGRKADAKHQSSRTRRKNAAGEIRKAIEKGLEDSNVGKIRNIKEARKEYGLP